MAGSPEVHIARDPNRDLVRQFTLFADNKVGRLNEIIGILAEHHIHILGITTLDTTDSTIIRLVVDYPEQAREVFARHHFPVSEAFLTVVELQNLDQLHAITCALVAAEINIHYVYPLLLRPGGLSALALRLEDNEIARDVLTRYQVRVLRQGDLAR